MHPEVGRRGIGRGSDRTAASLRRRQPAFANGRELDRRPHMCLSELGEIVNDLIGRHPAGEVLEHVVQGDSRADETRLPAAHAQAEPRSAPASPRRHATRTPRFDRRRRFGRRRRPSSQPTLSRPERAQARPSASPFPIVDHCASASGCNIGVWVLVGQPDVEVASFALTRLLEAIGGHSDHGTHLLRDGRLGDARESASGFCASAGARRTELHRRCPPAHQADPGESLD
jgi:hypothetical protein